MAARIATLLQYRHLRGRRARSAMKSLTDPLLPVPGLKAHPLTDGRTAAIVIARPAEIARTGRT
jgi:hypothetical protein